MPEISVGGVKIVYEVRGEGPPIVLVCGTGQPAASWQLFGTIDQLTSQGYQVVTFDNRGIPPSDVPPPPYTVEEMAGDCIALLDHLGAGPYVVMGASLGGLITQTVALTRPDLVRAAIFMVGCGNFSAYSRAQQRGLEALLALDEPPPDLVTALALIDFVPPSQWADENAVHAAVTLLGMFTMTSPDGFAGQIQADAKWGNEDHLTELERLEVPALAVAHEFDVNFTPVTVKEAVARMQRGEYVEVPGAAHVPLDPAATEASTSAVREFLARHAPVSSPV